MTTEAAIRKALDALGRTAEAIRASLKRRRIKGKRYAVGQCPLARYLLKKGFVVEVVPPDVMRPFGGSITRLKRHQSSFAFHFDAGEYPELVEPGVL